jgi:hypothetical protein
MATMDVVLNKCKVNMGNPGVFFLQVPSLYHKNYKVVKGQRMFVFMDEDKIIFSRTENTRYKIPLGIYSVSLSGQRGLKVTIPRVFVEARDITNSDHMIASLNSDGDLIYTKEVI